jgi:transposase
MRKIKDILRLGLFEKRSQREISDSLNIGKTTVQEYLARAEKLGVEWNDVKELNESKTAMLLYPKVLVKRSKVRPDWAAMRLELGRKGITLSLLWQEYKEQHEDGIGYSRFCDEYSNWKKLSRLSMRQEHKAGEKCFLDFSGLKVPYVDLKTNELKEAEVFVAVMGASSKTFAVATNTQTVEDWIYANIQALKFFGGVPAVLVPDNLKAGVITPCRYEAVLNPHFIEFSNHYQTAIIPARSRKPKDKSKVEVGVQVVERWILARLRRMTFSSVAEINQYIKPLLDDLNAKKMKHLNFSRNELFDSLDAPALKPLPNRDFEFSSWKKSKVHIDYHIELLKSLYSVPYKYVGQVVEVRYSNTTVTIFSGETQIAIHPRLRVAGAKSTLEDHMPSAHKAHAKWTPDRILNWTESLSGEETVTLVRSILNSKIYPEQAFRSCLGIIRMIQDKGEFRVEEAAFIVNQSAQQIYRKLKSVIEAKNTSFTPKALNHENIRGKNYYN